MNGLRAPRCLGAAVSGHSCCGGDFTGVFYFQGKELNQLVLGNSSAAETHVHLPEV